MKRLSKVEAVDDPTEGADDDKDDWLAQLPSLISYLATNLRSMGEGGSKALTACKQPHYP